MPSRSSAWSSTIDRLAWKLRRDRRAGAGRALDEQRAVERLDPVAQAGQPAAGRVGAAGALVADAQHERSLRIGTTSTSAGAAGVLGDVRQRLGDDEVGDRLDHRQEPLGQLAPVPRPGWPTAAQRLERGRAARGRRAPAARSRGRGREARRSRRRPRGGRRGRARGPRAGRSSRSSALPSCMLSATSRACAPSWRSRSIRRSSAACTSRAPRRVRVSSSTRSASSRSSALATGAG